MKYSEIVTILYGSVYSCTIFGTSIYCAFETRKLRSTEITTEEESDEQISDDSHSDSESSIKSNEANGDFTVIETEAGICFITSDYTQNRMKNEQKGLNSQKPRSNTLHYQHSKQKHLVVVVCHFWRNGSDRYGQKSPFIWQYCPISSIRRLILE